MTDDSSKSSGGRPSKYEPQFARQAQKLCELGATDRELAEFFQVDKTTLYRWRGEHPELVEAMTVGKEHADERVIQSLYHRAIGYSFDSQKIFQYEGKPVTVPFVEHIPPDVTACIFWLKNRRRKDWRDSHEFTGEDGGPIQFERIERVIKHAPQDSQ